MKPISGRNIAWAAFAYAALMGPVALVIAAIAAHRHVEMTFGELTYFAAFAFVWPLQVPVALVAIWYLGASTVFLFWKWLEIVQFLTEQPLTVLQISIEYHIYYHCVQVQCSSRH